MSVEFYGQVVVEAGRGSDVRLGLDAGATPRDAVYVGGSGSNTLLFQYVVQMGDSSPDLDVAGTAIELLNGATIRSVSAGVNANLTVPAPGAFSLIAFR